MIRRLLLALLAFCLALPAAAAPLHCPPAETMATSGHHGHSRHKREDPPRHAQPAHDCIGCIAPLAGVPRPMAATRFAAVPPEARPTPPIVGRVSGPDTPPPRA